LLWLLSLVRKHIAAACKQLASNSDLQSKLALVELSNALDMTDESLQLVVDSTSKLFPKTLLPRRLDQ
jgi:hypothetical protein